jgi:signal transduction histidine kinase/CheY-like chemotaxis protein/ABC-type amino acid transport substrate-binding protein/HPt (histidine-containing phosphotransfer) domain-containing protein
MQLDMGKRVRLTDKERDWLNQHRTVRLGVDSNLPPFEFLDDDGKYSGISADYIEVLSKQLDIAMIPQLEYSWSEAIKAIEEGGNIDILPGVVNTPDRQEYMNFTKSYISFPVVIAMQNDAPYIGGLSDMSGKKVGVIRGYFSHKMLEANHPEIIPVFVETVADGLIAVDKGETDAFFEDMAVITYEKNRLGLDNIKIAAPSKFKTDLSIGVRKDWPELIPILNKALDTIDKKERAAIQNTWMSFRVSFGWDIKTILLWALPIGGGAALIIFIIVLWNRRLGTEIIERKRAEEDLAVRTNLLQTVLSSMTQGIVAFDKDLELISWNNRFKEIRDYPSEFFEEGRNFREFMQYDIDRDEFIYEDPGIGLEQQVERAKQFEPHTFERQRPDGSFIEVRGGPIPGGGFVSTYADVTVRKRAELELKIAKEKADTATQVAEEATKAKATFLATMSHEIRTPMGGVIGMVDLLRQSKMTDDQRQMIDTVGDSAHSLLTIINDILDFSKIEAGKLDLEEIPISIRDVVEGAGEALAVNARNKDIGLSVYVDPDIPDALVGDQVRVRQILFNFGTNAIKFTEKGKVLLRADKVPSQDKGKATVRFQVIDEGIGIPEEAQAKLFQAFSQVDASTTRRFGGTGLGLTICQRLTEIMNGEIGVESVPGEGSTFSVTIAFPVAEEHTFKSDGHDLDGLNVLLAYKDDVMRVLVPRYLEHWKATVTATAEFDKAKSMALDAARDGTPFDVICLGSGWPFDEQVDAARSLQAEKKLSSTGYVVACRGRVKVDRPEIDNTVYVDAGPLRRAAFIKSVAVAAGRASPEVEYDDSEITLDAGKAPTVAEAEAMGQLILVAEDNVTNQDVIRRQLTMLGYALEIANDGKEALELLQSKSFAILLTDCHMPNMDGFELTETIRKSEKDNDVRFPIVAITASVMKEEVDNCFAAGMDDYLAKPLEMKKLKEMLQNWMPASDGVAEAAEEPDAEDTTDKPEAEDDGGDGPIDPSALKSVFGDDDDTFKEILKDFVTPATNNIADIESAFADRSADDVAKAAHKLKSSARAVGANELADLCLTLETAGKAEDWDEIDKSAPRITEVMKEVADYIARM